MAPVRPAPCALARPRAARRRRARLRRGRAARALPRRDGRRAAGVGHRGRRLVRPQPGGRRHLAVPVRRRGRRGGRRLQRRAPHGRGSWASTRPRRRASPVRSSRPTGASSGREDRLVERDGWAALAPPRTRPPPAPTALLVAGLVERREATRRRRARRAAGRARPVPRGPDRAVGRRARQLRRSGPRRPEPGVYSKYYTGETYWALARLHRLVPRRRAGASSPTGSAPTWRPARDDAEDHWPPIPDHWAAYGLAETVAFEERRATSRSPTTRRPTPRSRRGCSGRRCGG